MILSSCPTPQQQKHQSFAEEQVVHTGLALSYEPKSDVKSIEYEQKKLYQAKSMAYVSLHSSIDKLYMVL